MFFWDTGECESFIKSKNEAIKLIWNYLAANETIDYYITYRIDIYEQIQFILDIEYKTRVGWSHWKLSNLKQTGIKAQDTICYCYICYN